MKRSGRLLGMAGVLLALHCRAGGKGAAGAAHSPYGKNFDKISTRHFADKTKSAVFDAFAFALTAQL
jgi:hypothetical protein